MNNGSNNGVTHSAILLGGNMKLKSPNWQTAFNLVSFAEPSVSNQIVKFDNWSPASTDSGGDTSWYNAGAAGAPRIYWWKDTNTSNTRLISTKDIQANGVVLSSDDRLKEDEELIINANDTLLKLRPQKYKKKNVLDSTETIVESGLIAQEIYYEVPELRHLVNVPEDATLVNDTENKNFDEIRNDPDYSNWGSKEATVNYNGLIPYLIKALQEQNNEMNELKDKYQKIKVENNQIKSIIEKIKTATSFDDLKNL